MKIKRIDWLTTNQYDELFVGLNVQQASKQTMLVMVFDISNSMGNPIFVCKFSLKLTGLWHACAVGTTLVLAKARTCYQIARYSGRVLNMYQNPGESFYWHQELTRDSCVILASSSYDVWSIKEIVFSGPRDQFITLMNHVNSRRSLVTRAQARPLFEPHLLTTLLEFAGCLRKKGKHRVLNVKSS
jgi:hypothetical protein